MSSASWALQRAIFAALAANSASKALAGDPLRLYDAPPRGAAFPYIVFAEDAEARWDTATDRGREHAITFHVWSRAGGRKQAKEIADAICTCLEETTLSPAGHHLVDFDFEKASFGRMSDGKTFRAALDFRAVTEPEE